MDRVIEREGESHRKRERDGGEKESERGKQRWEARERQSRRLQIHEDFLHMSH